MKVTTPHCELRSANWTNGISHPTIGIVWFPRKRKQCFWRASWEACAFSIGTPWSSDDWNTVAVLYSDDVWVRWSEICLDHGRSSQTIFGRDLRRQYPWSDDLKCANFRAEVGSEGSFKTSAKRMIASKASFEGEKEVSEFIESMLLGELGTRRTA